MKIKRAGFICLLSIFSLSVFSQTIDHWEAIFYNNTTFKYQTSDDSITDANWRNPDYDDSGWLEGTGGIGYGDDDDNTITDTVASIFLRKEFTITDSLEIEAAILHIDYDDAFIAFLNGVEIARGGSLFEALPAFDALAFVDKEANIPEGGLPDEFIINSSIIQANLRTGTNTLAVQVHNVTLISSDLSSNIWLSVGLNVETERYLPPPVFTNEPETFSSNLPILVIETENGITIPDDPKITAQLGIIYNGPGARNNSDDAYNEYNGYIGIETRGNSTSLYPKKPYNFETRDIFGENRNVSILGMPAENDWVLRASYFDHTFIRNPLANHMARQTGYWASRTRHIELILNGEYQGIYLLMEKLKRDDNRLDIAKLEPTETSGEDLTGGYIWEITGFEDDFGESRKIKYPKLSEITTEQLAYLQATDNAFRNKMRQAASEYANPNTGYIEHIWTESFIYEILVQEAMRNSDAYGWSGYYHKDKNGLINAGPAWDFDQSSGNSSYPDNGVVTGWLAEHAFTSNTPFYWPLLLNEPYFKYSLSLRWNELRVNKFSTENLLAYVDSIASVLAESQAREFEKWPVLGQNIWRETSGYNLRDTYQKEVDYLKDFLTERWEWMDAQLSSIAEPAGYPEITRETDFPDTVKIQLGRNIYLNLNNLIAYPYSSKMKYAASSTNTLIVEPDVKKSDTLKLEPVNFGFCDIIVTVTDTYGNKKNISFTCHVGLTFENINESIAGINNRFAIYPNPASGTVYINSQAEFKGKVNIELYSYTGQHVTTMYQGQSQEITQYDFSNIANGIYFIQITTENRAAYTQKVTVYH